MKMARSPFESLRTNGIPTGPEDDDTKAMGSAGVIDLREF